MPLFRGILIDQDIDKHLSYHFGRKGGLGDGLQDLTDYWDLASMFEHAVLYEVGAAARVLTDGQKYERACSIAFRIFTLPLEARYVGQQSLIQSLFLCQSLSA